MITLRRMSQEDYLRYQEASLPLLAEETMRATGMEREHAEAAAKRSFDSLLPSGTPDAQDQHLCLILNDEQKVGYLWFGVRRDQPSPYAYIWDILIDPPHRGRGLGTSVLLVLEEKIRELGLAKIALNVFGHNDGARRLYERMGYVPTQLRMEKVVSRT